MDSFRLTAALKAVPQAATSALISEPLYRWLLCDWPVDLRLTVAATVVYDEVVQASVVRFVVDGEVWMARAWEFQPYHRTWEVRAPSQEQWRRGSKAELRRMITMLAQEYREATSIEAAFYAEES